MKLIKLTKELNENKLSSQKVSVIVVNSFLRVQGKKLLKVWCTVEDVFSTKQDKDKQTILQTVHCYHHPDGESLKTKDVYGLCMYKTLNSPKKAFGPENLN